MLCVGSIGLAAEQQAGAGDHLCLGRERECQAATGVVGTGELIAGLTGPGECVLGGALIT